MPKKRGKGRASGDHDHLSWKAVEFDRDKFGRLGENFEGMLAIEEIDASEFFGKAPKEEQENKKKKKKNMTTTATTAKGKGKQSQEAPGKGVGDEEEKEDWAESGKRPKKTKKKKKKKPKKKPTKEQKERRKRKAQADDDDGDFSLFDSLNTSRGEPSPSSKGKSPASRAGGTKEKAKAAKRARLSAGAAAAAAGGGAEEESRVPGDAEVRKSAWRTELKLCDEVARAMCAKGFKTPTPIQSKCVPLAGAGGKDIVAAAPTGSGKTLAFCLPILHWLHSMAAAAASASASSSSTSPPPSTPSPRLAALILTPTRDLATQILGHFRSAARFTKGVKAELIVGGLSNQKQERVLSKRPQVVIGTPGRIWELMSGGNEHLTELKGLRFLVLDEADRMLEKGHFRDLNTIIHLIKSQTKVKAGGDGARGGEKEKLSRRQTRKKQKASYSVQTLLFSATMTIEASGREVNNSKKRLKKGLGDKPVNMIAELKKRLPFRAPPVVVDLSKTKGHNKLAKGVTDYVVECVDQEKDVYLYYFLTLNPGKTLVFVNSISCLRRVSAILSILKLTNLYSMHAKMQQRQRLKSLERFRTHDNAVLIASDVAARGLDVKGVQFIVNYQLPRSAEVYIHRCGRTGRAAEEGVSFSLIGPSDQKPYRKICSVMGRQDIPEYPLESRFLRQIKQRISLALKIDAILSKRNKRKSNNDWFRKNAKLMDIDLDDDLLDDDEEDQEARVEQGKCKQMQAALDRMLKEPLVAQGINRNFLSLNENMTILEDGKLNIGAIRR
eukprot:CAMPEP_0114521558 /NCGR_PEP_ID=MMETSP0109-20121206/20247_1 /TAXON_ID=29199 /ORGANISM="Chlorarachnion reptans, Strain CCCM449" /LENGTH=780 /DNA_ID=CAMNT_0001702665 /DNA_START=142 /DNA_END=2484 /DNA_ORIENTATION=-